MDDINIRRAVPAYVAGLNQALADLSAGRSDVRRASHADVDRIGFAAASWTRFTGLAGGAYGLPGDEA